MLENLPKTSSRILGFTVIEVLIGVAISTTIALVLTTVLSQTLQGGNKSDLLSIVKQDGQTALTTIETSVRDSDGLACIYNDTSVSPRADAIVVETNGTFTRFRFYDPVTTGTPSNGYLVEDEIPSTWINSIPPDSGYSSLCQDSGPYGVDSPNAVKITDLDKVTGISIANAQFSNPSPGLVGIKFDGLPGVSAGTGIENEIGSNGIHFETTVEIRNQNAQ